MKKLFSLLLALSLSAALALPALAADFTDVPPSHAFYDAVTDCAAKGIVGGYDDGTFRPGNTVTKNNFTVMLSRAFYAGDIAKYNSDSYNRDIYGSFAGNYLALYYAGAFEGASFYEDFIMHRFDVMNTGIDRYDMAQLMTNIMNAKGFAASSAEKSAVTGEIKDYASIPSQYQDAVANVYALGVIGGFADGTFGGSGTMTWGQSAVVIYRMTQKAGGSVTAPETPTTPVTPETPTTPETPATPETPVTPETPAVSTGGTLTNGKPITEENVTEILNQLQEKYPRKTDFSKGYGGLGSGRTPSKNCIAQVTNRYGFTTSHSQSVSTTSGCGGWAAFVADEIFGQTGVTWKKTTMANARPGDLMIILDDAGYLVHVSIYVNESTRGFPKTMEVYNTGASTSSSGVYRIGWGNNNAPGTVPVDIYTAYPD